MAEDNKIEVQIVLDDGSVVRGFQKIEKEADKAAKKTGGAFDDVIGSASALTGAITATAAAFAVVGTAAGFAISQILKGDQLKLIETQFKNISAEVGIASEQLSNRFRESLGGLTDDSDALKVLNEGMVLLGDNANQLPEIFELSRKASNVFGGEAVDNFKRIEEAIASGNTKSLRSIGLRVNEKQVLDEYAKSIGTTADLLSEAAKQQAIMNAVLERGRDKFASISTENGTATEALKRLGVSLGNLADEFAIRVSNTFGPFFKLIIDGANKFVSTLQFGNKLESLSEVESKIKNISNQLKTFSAGETVNVGFASFSAGAEKVKALEANLDDLLRKRDILKAQEEDAAKRGETASAAQVEAIRKIRQAQVDADLEKKLALENQEKFDNEFLQKEIALDQFRLQSKLIGADAETQARLLQEAEISQHQQNLADIEINNAELVGISLADINAAKELEAQRHAAVLDDIEKKRLNNQAAQDKQKLQQLSSTFGQIASLTQSNSQELQAIGKGAAVVQATIDGYAAVQGAFKFGNTFGGPALGFSLAALVGTAAAANIAKIVATGSGTAPGAGTSFSPATGGGVAPGTTAPIGEGSTIANNEVETKAGPQIQVTIQGDVLDSDQTGLRIVDLINKAFDQQGAVLTA